ncbi:hypothetical protein GCM10011352_37650 [Marinobacterium zhoushanense]|uniref:Negative regulator of flagellin synthesis n=1 Tax=Marinobacterium zhoushanense TaxID=1679163 RepID=A0ABQ1KRF9_9GAMM|nr:flagellar biosynthesis anti-sigma factor FlgM [Marinobacterium zhoushanense]GGC07815.1 hypothetical protein GCM10011352_37650 [Marinobacterium zhoushanense]
MAIDLPGVGSTQAGTARNNRVNNEQQNNTAATGSGGSAQPSVGPSNSDTVKISETALAIHNAIQNGDDEPEVNSDRVAALKSAIESGEYKVDAERVAKGMLAIESLFS